jgi:HPt (histidine-containing phosphotransfer) domain-containing protein
MTEMISLYLEQTPPLVEAMKQGLQNKNWSLLRSAIHKMIPSFSIMGISVEFQNLAKKVQEDASKYAQLNQSADDHDPYNLEIAGLVLLLEKVCMQACDELVEELIVIKTINDENHK